MALICHMKLVNSNCLFDLRSLCTDCLITTTVIFPNLPKLKDGRLPFHI